MNDNGQPVETWNLPGLRRIQRWQTGAISHWQCRHISLCVLPDGRWVVDHTDTLIGARAYPSEARAREIADQLMVGGEWREVPAAYDANGQPTTPGWVRRGSTWWRADS